MDGTIFDNTEATTDPVVYVDIPDYEGLAHADKGNEVPWINVGKFKTKKQALAWIRKHIGPCDSEGRVKLLVNA